MTRLDRRLVLFYFYLTRRKDITAVKTMAQCLTSTKRAHRWKNLTRWRYEFGSNVKRCRTVICFRGQVEFRICATGVPKHNRILCTCV